MKQPVLFQAAPPILAAIFLASYASLVFGVPGVAAWFADFKIELSAPTMLAINLARFVTSPAMFIAFGALMLALAFVLAKRQKWAWNVGFVLSLFFSLNLIASMLPLLTIVYGLSGDDDGQMLTLQLLPYIAGVGLVVFLPPLLFLALRRAFLGRQLPPTPASLA